MRVRRIVLGIILVVFAVQGVLQSFGGSGITLRNVVGTLAIFAPFYAVAMFAKKKILVGSALAAIIILNLAGAATITFT
jgi:hypothetical protein